MVLQRPKIYQTYAPFVEFYVSGVDILRSSDGKPRSLISFTHNQYEMGSGIWELEVFDANHIEFEELMLGIESREGSSGSDDSGDPADYDLLKPVVFRYGYVSPDGKVFSTSLEGEEYFFGSIFEFRPTFQPNGTLFYIRGGTTGYLTKNSVKAKREFYAKDIYAVIKEICQLMDWILVPLPADPGVVELSPEKMPAPITVTSSAIDSTEEQPATIKMGEGETYYKFIQRLCLMARPNDPKYNGYTCYLESRVRGKDGTPKCYLYFGPMDVHRGPVRKYVYMRDQKSDVISFSPQIAVWVSEDSGVTSGAFVKGDDRLRGFMTAHMYSHVNLDMKTMRLRRQVGTTMTLPQMAQFQTGIAELGEESTKRPEGGAAKGTVLTAPHQSDPDSPSVELSSFLTDAQMIDHATMCWWLGMHTYVNTATLEIFGDPSPEIAIENNVLVVYYVPVANEEFRIHWITQMWNIVGVTHSIQGGSYTTHLSLAATSHESGVATRQAWDALTEGMDPDAMKKLGG